MMTSLSELLFVFLSGTSALTFSLIAIGLLEIGFFLLYLPLKKQSVALELSHSNLSSKNLDGVVVKGASNFLQNNEVLTSIERLTELSRTMKLDQIVGIHTGGRLVSVLLCNEMGIDPKNCAYIATDTLTTNSLQLAPNINRLHGNILVVDDVTRKGTTLEAVRRKLLTDFLKGRNGIQKATYATLAFVWNENKRDQIYFKPDWSSIVTTDEYIQFPWSILSEAVKEAYINRSRKTDFNQDMIDTHALLISDYEFSLYCVKIAVSDPNKFNELVREGRLKSTWETLVEH